MRDMLFELLEARKKKVFKVGEFKKLLIKLKACDKHNKINWDDGAGEEWAFVNGKDFSIMLNSKVGICFVCGVLENNYLNLLSYCNCVFVNGFDVSEWYIDLYELKKQVPEIVWPISDESINPSSFSLDEFYFITV